MQRFRQFLVAIVTAAVLASPLEARAQDSTTEGSAGQNNSNSAIAINTKDGADLFRLAFSIDRLLGNDDETDPQNAAVAYSSCQDCSTTAIAIQVVLLMSPPDGEATPTNIALAINQGCESCETVALAYQIVLQTDGPVKLTSEGKQEIKRILGEIAALEQQDLPPAELDAQTSTLVGELGTVLDTELRPKSSSSDKQQESETGDLDPSDQLPSPGMTTSPSDNTDLGDGSSPPPASSSPSSGDSSPSPSGSSPSPGGQPSPEASGDASPAASP